MAEFYHHHDKLDVVFALGYNKGFWGADNVVINDPSKLSGGSKMTVRAASYLLENITDHIMFLTGITIPGVIEECYAMQMHGIKYFPIITLQNSSCEPFSFTTKTNGIYGTLLAQELGFKKAGVLSFGEHARHGAYFFELAGQKIEKVFRSEQVVYEDIRKTDPRAAKKFKRDVNIYKIKSGNALKEWIRGIMIKTIDKNGDILDMIAYRTRKRALLNT